MISANSPLVFRYGLRLGLLALFLIGLAMLFSSFRTPHEPPNSTEPTVTTLPSESRDLIDEFQNMTDLPLVGPAGFELREFAGGFEQPRVLAADAKGRLLVSDQRAGEVNVFVSLGLGALFDDDEIILDLATNLHQPHGLLFLDDTTLLIAEEQQITEWEYDLENPRATFVKKLVDLPTGGGHRSRTLQKGNDGKIYVTIGSSCNVCEEDDERRAAMYHFNPDGSEFTPWASGLRNTVFFVPHPETGYFWGNDMGRDLLGDDLPPDELNVIPTTDGPVDGWPGDFGWPRCYGDNVHDTDFDRNVVYKDDPCADARTIGTSFDYPAHVAPLGLRFIPSGIGWPENWEGDLLVSFHGSWNSTVPVGYKIVRLELDDNDRITATHDFMTGFLDQGQLVGRPVDLLFIGSDLFVSDDGRGSLYRIRPVAKDS